MQNINEFLANKRNDMVDDLLSLVRINSEKSEGKENMPFGEGNRKVLDKAFEIAQRLGFETTDYDGYVGACDIGRGDIKVAILCHLDVVPAGDGWTVWPFDGVVKDGKVIARGAIDDKGPAISSMYALYALKELGIELDGKVRLILGCDEECGGSDIEYYLTKEKMPDMVFTPDGEFPVINVEKGRAAFEFAVSLPEGVEIDAGVAINAMPGIATAVIPAADKERLEKAIDSTKLSGISLTEENGRLSVSVQGKSAHASTPDGGDNALTKLIAVLSRVYPNTDIDSLSRIFPHGENHGRGGNIYFSDELSGETTCVFSVLKNGVGKVDVRSPISVKGKTVIDNLTDVLAQSGITVTSAQSVEPHHVDGESDFVKTLLAVYEEQTGNKGECLAIGGGTYVHDLDTGVAFGAEIKGVDYHMHGADEFITIDELVKNAQIYAHAVARLQKI